MSLDRVSLSELLREIDRLKKQVGTVTQRHDHFVKRADQIPDVELARMAGDVLTLDETGVWPVGRPPDWIETLTSFMGGAVGRIERHAVAKSMVRSEVMRRFSTRVLL